MLTISAQEEASWEIIAKKFSNERDVDTQFEWSQKEFGEHHIDSLKHISATYFSLKRYDKALVYLNVLSNFYIYKTIQHKEAYDNLENFKPYVDKCSDAREIGKFYVAFAEAASYLEKLPRSVELSKEGITYLEQVKDSSLYEFGYLYLKSAEALSKLNSNARSAEHFEKASAIFTKQNDTLFYLWSQNGLATLLGRNGLYAEAHKARKVVYELGPKINEEQVVAMAHLQAAIEANFNDKHDELYHYRNAIKFRNEDSDIQEIITILSLSYASEAFARRKKIDTAKIYLKRLEEKMEGKSFNSQLKTNYDFSRAFNALTEGRLNDSENIAMELKSHIDATKDAGLSLRINRLLSEIYEAKGNSVLALSFYKKYSSINDSLLDATSQNRFAYVQTKFETEKKDLEIATQRQDITLLNTKNRLKSQWMLFGGLGLLALFSFVYIIRSRNFALHKQKRQEMFSRELIEAQEIERTRLARELHDSVGQKLMLLTRQTKSKNDAEMEFLANNTLEEIRSISRGLHPATLERLGVTTAIQSLVNEVDEHSDIFVTSELDNIDEIFNKDAELHLYRIIQEALNNILKHSEAKATSISIVKQTEEVLVTVSDNGKGFDVSEESKYQNSLGMKTLLERSKMIGAHFKIDSKPNNGTILSLAVPI